MHSSMIQHNNPEWQSFLESATHDIYHLPEYCQLEASYSDAEARAHYVKEGNKKVLTQMLIRPIPDSLNASKVLFDATSSYGYSSPLISHPDDHAFLESALRRFIAKCVDENLVCAFFRLHPLIPIPLDILNKFGCVKRVGKTVYIDLSLTKEQLLNQMRRNHKDGIRKLAEENFHISIDRWEQYDEFIDMYLENMVRVGASDFYLFDRDYFHKLKLKLNQHMHLFTVTDPSNKLAAASLFTEVNGIVQHHLSASADEFQKKAPTKLIVYNAIEWAKDNGHSVIHLGGGVGGREDSLFHFKKGFSKTVADFYTFSVIFDMDNYEFLSRKWSENTGQTDSEFFPVYRTPD